MRGKQKDDYEEQHQSNNLNQTEIESSSSYDKNINEYEELKNHINGRFEDLEKKMLEKFGRLLNNFNKVQVRIVLKCKTKLL